MKLGQADRIALRTSVAYAVIAAAWILGSDALLVSIMGPSAKLVRYEVLKGWAFVVVTALLLYGALRAQLTRIENSRAARERAESELLAQRERLQLAAKAANIGFWEIRIGTDEAFYTTEWKRHLGYTEAEIPNQASAWGQHIHPQDRERVDAALASYCANPVGPYRQEYRFRHRDGSYRWILSQGTMQFDAEGRPLRLLGAHVDVTVGKQVEAALRERAEIHARLAHIAAVVPGAIVSFHLSRDGRPRFSYASPAVQDIYGYSAEALAEDASPIFNAIHRDDSESVLRSIDESRRTMRPWRGEFRYQHPTKGEVWIEGFSLPEAEPDGGMLWNGFVMDVTQRKRAELRVHHLNRVYAVLSDINQTIVRVRDPQLLFEAACRIAVEHGEFRMAWIARVDPLTSAVLPVASAGVVDHFLDGYEANLLHDASSTDPTVVALTTGRHVVGNDIAQAPRSAAWREAALTRGYRSYAIMPFRVHGQVVGALHLYADVADAFDDAELQLLDEVAIDLSFALEISEGEAGRLRTEASSRESEERFRQLAESIREIFWLIDPVTRRVLYVNPVYETVSGYSVASLYANPDQWFEIIHPDDRVRILKANFGNPDPGAYEEEFRMIRRDGAVRWIRARAFPIRDQAGNIYRLAGVSEDVTDRKQLEEQFFRAQRLEAIGTLASGIAHDLNNVLAPIMMCAPMLRMGLAAADFEKMLATIEASTRRGADLVRQLLVFGRGVEGGRGPVGPKALIGEMVKIARETFPKNIVVEVSLPDGLWDMVSDATQLHQVLMNLCVNARDAMPDGGTLTVGAENIVIDAAAAAGDPNSRQGDYVRLSVRDTGTGIAPEHREKIFDPFFTTKAPGKGTGLGLSTVLGIVKSHGGFVRLESEVGRGSRFEVFIPAKHGAAEKDAEGDVVTSPRGNGELVLLVEDEVSIREVVADILVRQNYRVMTAEDGLEGEVLFKENVDDIALIVTDLDMPRMDGIRLIRAVRQVKPSVAVVVSTGLRSGRPTNERATELEELGVSAVLAKPFAAAEMLSAVHAALTKSRAR